MRPHPTRRADPARRPVPAATRASIPAPTLLVALALVVAGSPALADQHADVDAEDKVEEIVEERAEEEASDGEAAGADIGEASYNIEDCRPANEEVAVGEEEGEEDGDDEEDEESDTVVAMADDVEDKELDPCRDMDK